MRESKTNQLVKRKWSRHDEKEVEALKNLRWTSHNIPLTFDQSTIGNHDPLIAEDRRTRIIKENLRLFLGNGGTLSGKRLIDLGCLEGGLSFEMAREDMIVLGVEGRESNFRKCQMIEEYFALPNLNYIHLDVKGLSREEHGVFDVILCCGLLYHLDDPVRFLHAINSMTSERGVLFLDTHIAPSDEKISDCIYRTDLSDIESMESEGVTYQGRWFQEYSESMEGTDEEWASISNYRSYWLTYESLMRALFNAGFGKIYQVNGGFGIDIEIGLFKEQSRGYWIALNDQYCSSGKV